MNDNEQLTFEGMPAPAPVQAAAESMADTMAALIEFAEAHGVSSLPYATFADRLRAKVREVTRGRGADHIKDALTTIGGAACTG